MRLTNKIIASLTAATMLGAPVAAQAGTRAGDSSARIAPVAQSVTSEAGYVGKKVSEENRLAGAGLIIAVLAGIAVVAGVVIAADDDGSDGA